MRPILDIAKVIAVIDFVLLKIIHASLENYSVVKILDQESMWTSWNCHSVICPLKRNIAQVLTLILSSDNCNHLMLSK